MRLETSLCCSCKPSSCLLSDGLCRSAHTRLIQSWSSQPIHLGTATATAVLTVAVAPEQTIAPVQPWVQYPTSSLVLQPHCSCQAVSNKEALLGLRLIRLLRLLCPLMTCSLSCPVVGCCWSWLQQDWSGQHTGKTNDSTHLFAAGLFKGYMMYCKPRKILISL